MTPLDLAKTAHMHKTPQMEIIERLQAENIELKEKITDYQKLLMSIRLNNAIEALDDWFSDDDDE